MKNKSRILIIALFLLIGLANGVKAQWQQGPPEIGSCLYKVYFTDSLTGFIVGDGGNLLTTRNCGTTWSCSNFSQYRSIISLSFINKSTGYALFDSGRIIKTTDNGLTWNNTVPVVQVIYPSSFCFTDTNTGYITDPNGTVYKTTNGGISWLSFASFNNHMMFFSVNFLNPNKGFVIGYDDSTNYSIILKTLDGGTTWTNLNQGFTSLLTSSYFINSDTGYVVGSNGTILKTINGGSTWTNKISGVNNYLKDVHFLNENIGCAVGDSGIILQTFDGGNTWNTINSGTIKLLTSVFVVDSNTFFVVGGHYTILKIVNGIVTNIPTLKENNNISLYPNPTSSTLTIESNSNTKQNLKIVNLLGQTMYTYNIYSKATVDVSAFPKGIYLLKINTDKGIVVKKFVKE